MKYFLSILLFLPMSFLSADTSSASELLQFRNNTMDILDNPHCRRVFKRYIKKKQPKAFIYVPRSKKRTAFCNIVALKTTKEDAIKMVISRCENVKKKSKKNPLTAPCIPLAINHELLLTRADFGLKPSKKDMFYITERYGLSELKSIIEKGIDINKKSERGLTMLHIAIIENKLESVKYLVSQGTDLKLKNNHGDDALIIATKENHNDIFEYLLSQGADIKTTSDKNKRQAIHIAARNGFIGIIDVVLNEGVDINDTTENDESPLKLAIQSHYKPVVKYLVEKGADINTKDKSGKTPLDYANKYRNNRIVDYLIEKGAKTSASL